MHMAAGLCNRWASATSPNPFFSLAPIEDQTSRRGGQDAGRLRPVTQIWKGIEMKRKSNDHRWGVILAGGDGVRLKSLTRLVSGDDRPKQFSPLLGGRTLLGQTRLRIAERIDRDRTLFVLTSAHKPFYEKELENVPPNRMLVQPGNRGTLAAILWSLFRIVRHDEHALIVFFPSDHHYAKEDEFMTGVASAFDLAEIDEHSVILLGAAPTHPEIEYGWIEPGVTVTGPSRGSLRTVKRFWEKPSYRIARSLFERGCVWNTFVMAGRATAFLEMVREASPRLYRNFEPILALTDSAMETEAIQRIYDDLPVADFSKQVLAVSTERLAVTSIDDTGWSDLGDPHRLTTALFKNGIETPWVTSGRCNHCGLPMGTEAASRQSM
jgi:mannose-1-phosphate guanylyltransferase